MTKLTAAVVRAAEYAELKNLKLRIARAKKPTVYTPEQRERRKEQCRLRREKIKAYRAKKLEYYHARKANKALYELYKLWRTEPEIILKNDFFYLEEPLFKNEHDS